MDVFNLDYDNIRASACNNAVADRKLPCGNKAFALYIERMNRGSGDAIDLPAMLLTGKVQDHQIMNLMNRCVQYGFDFGLACCWIAGDDLIAGVHIFYSCSSIKVTSFWSEWDDVTRSAPMILTPS